MPNDEQVRYWNDHAGPRWVALSDQLDRLLGPLGQLAMDRARVQAGSRVLDVGCGCGDTTIELARRVGPGGQVVGVDVSGPMLERARARARAHDLPNACFEHGDAQLYSPSQLRFDRVFSRFGIMFFEAPRAALHHLLDLLVPGGRLSFVCWRALSDNPWLTVPLDAAARHMPLPPPHEPRAPGPFAFAEPEYVQGLLEAAGYVAIESERIDRELDLAGGAGLDAAVQLAMASGLVARALEQANVVELAPIASSIRSALSAYARNERVLLASSSWIFTAASPIR